MGPGGTAPRFSVGPGSRAASLLGASAWSSGSHKVFKLLSQLVAKAPQPVLRNASW